MRIAPLSTCLAFPALAIAGQPVDAADTGVADMLAVLESLTESPSRARPATPKPRSRGHPICKP